MASKEAQRKAPIQCIQIDEEKCNGCVLCMRSCPTKAIRVMPDRVARIEGVCINCGECIRVCPRRAVQVITAASERPKKGVFSTVSPSTVLYSQFEEDVIPNDILLALRKMGFAMVYDEGYTDEIYNVALDLHIKANRESPDTPRPLISPICPVVVRLIAYRFPALLKHIPPFLTPSEIVAKETKKRLAKKYGYRLQDIRVFHVTPCAAKLIRLKEPLQQKKSYVDVAIGIADIYKTLKINISELEEDKVLHNSGGFGIGFGASGGEIAGMNSDCIAVSGLQETIHYLEKIEMGLLQEIDYVELRTCIEGCVGGLFTVADKYNAKRRIHRLTRKFGAGKRVKDEYVKKLYEQGFFFTDKRDSPWISTGSDLTIAQRIKKQNRVEKILKGLPGKECGVCGAPDCRTFAEDIVEGHASMEGCVFLCESAKKESAGEG